MPHLIAVAGPAGSGKTTWLSQFLQNPSRPCFYCSLGGDLSVDASRIAYCWPSVEVIADNQAPLLLSTLPEETAVYFELGFHLDLQLPFLESLPCHRVAVLPPNQPQSDWHDWADEIILGNDISPLWDPENLPQLWRAPLTGQVFDAPSLDDILIELTEGAYGQVYRVKGIFEMPDGRAFYVDFVRGLEGREYLELPIAPWLQGRPRRFSGIEVVGRHLNLEVIAATLKQGWLSDAAVSQYQQHYQALRQSLSSPAEAFLS